MKRTLAALTAVVIAAGLSLAAAVGPATADDTSTPAPAASTPAATTPAPTTPAPVQTSTPAPAPTASSTPATPATVPTTGSATPQARTLSSASVASTGVATSTTAQTQYVTVVWTVNGQPNSIWPQTFYSESAPSATTDISITHNNVPQTCGTAYQLDSYVVSAAFNRWIAQFKPGAVPSQIELTGATDSAYLAAGGSGKAYTVWYNTSATHCTYPCIADSSVSYTYNGLGTAIPNSGTISVPFNKDGSAGVLCEPFFVTATSWKYTTNAVWPQVIDQVDHVNGTPTGGNNVEIINSGTYGYAAAVTCGQGDIYASFVSNDSTLFPENDGIAPHGYLDGPGNPLPEHFLSDMGFTGPNPTYLQDNTDCWGPTAETGNPTINVQKCDAASDTIVGVNSVDAPAVPGGVWTITSTDGKTVYFTSAVGAPITNWEPTDTTISYSIVLSDNSSADAYKVTGTTTPYTPSNALDCRVLATPVTPVATDVQACGTTGSLDVTPTAGIDYYLTTSAVTNDQVTNGLSFTANGIADLKGLSGDATITAKAETGYRFADGTTTETLPKFSLGAITDCSYTAAIGTCVPIVGAVGTSGTESLTMYFTNPSGTDVTASIVGTNAGNTVSETFIIPSGSTSFPVTVNTAAASGDTYSVTIGTSAATTYTVPAFTGCTPTVIPADPTATPSSCVANADGVLVEKGDASISVDLEPGLIYSITGPAGDTGFTNLTGIELAAGQAPGKTVVATDVPTGFTYTITVVADTAAGYTLGTLNPMVWPYHLAVAQTACDISASATAFTCTPPLEIAAAPATVGKAVKSFTPAVTGYSTITITPNPEVTYTAYDSTDNTSFVLADVSTPQNVIDPGQYTVDASLSAKGVTDGFVLPTTGTSFGPFDLTAFCPPPGATYTAGVSGTDAVCTDGNTTDGVINLTHELSEAGKVTYTVVNSANVTVYTGATENSISVGAGTYTVTAAPPTGDGLSGLPPAGTVINSDGTWTFAPVVIGTSSTNCDDGGLAFTGGTIAWVGFILAGGMLFLGFALLYVRRRGNRTAE